MKSITHLLRAAVLTAALVIVGGLSATTARADTAKPVPGGEITATGEVVDMMCYVDHGAKGEKHAACAKGCIESGGPVGLLTSDGTVYLLIGEHEPANDKLAPYAAKTITVTGKFVEKSGVKMIENIQIKS